MDSSCPVQVALRVRDLVPRERLEGFFSCISVTGSTTAVLGGERSFAFHYAFGADNSQATVYDMSVRPLIESALSGINVSVLDESVHESLSTLQYATQARRIQNRICAPVSQHVPTPSEDSIVNLQWTLFRKYLSCVGLMPLPEILMQVRTCTESSSSVDVIAAQQQASHTTHVASLCKP